MSKFLDGVALVIFLSTMLLCMGLIVTGIFYMAVHDPYGLLFFAGMVAFMWSMFRIFQKVD